MQDYVTAIDGCAGQSVFEIRVSKLVVSRFGMTCLSKAVVREKSSRLDSDNVDSTNRESRPNALPRTRIGAARISAALFKATQARGSYWPSRGSKKGGEPNRSQEKEECDDQYAVDKVL
jgi:hypothetical protein